MMNATLPFSLPPLPLPSLLLDPQLEAVKPYFPLLAVFLLGIGATLFWKWLTGPSYVSKKRDGKYFDRKGNKFEQHRRKHFPPAYPNGWYHLASSVEIPSGSKISISALGREFVVFRGTDGKIGVLDAFCPHLGAHLGNGTVEGNCLSCPFHGWKFECDGKVKEIPYMPEGSEVPGVAKTRAYEVVERWGYVFIWFDAENRPPLWQLMDKPELTDGSTYYGGATEMEFDQYISEMAENSADPWHFNTLHAPFPLHFLGPFKRFFTLHHTTLLEFPYKDDPAKQHICVFNLTTQMLFLNKFEIGPPQKIVSTFEGPSIMHFRVFGPLGTVHSLKTLLPLKPFKQHTTDIWWADKAVPRWYGSLVAYIAQHALEQDREVWESKGYVANPLLVKGDGPFNAHRRWYQQFYSENSRKVAEEGALDW